MTLTVLVGNTNTRLTWFQARRPKLRRVVPTSQVAARPEHWLRPHPRVSAAALASVVPRLTAACRRTIRQQTGLVPFVPTAKSRTGLRILYPRAQLGIDRLCAVLGARTRFQGNLLVLDFGTAVTVNLLTRDDRFLGGAILPGLDLMQQNLHQAAARLPHTRPRPLARVLQRDTRSGIRTGTWHLLLGGISRIIARARAETQGPCSVVATGGAADLVRRHLNTIRAVDPDLAARGLLELLIVNRRLDE